MLSFRCILLTLLASTATMAQLVCVPSVAPLAIRSEGFTERVSDILLNCSGGPSRGSVNSAVIAMLNVGVTNRILDSNGTSDVVLTANNGSTLVTFNGVAQANGVVFSNASFTLSDTGSVTLEISNLRVNAVEAAAVSNQLVMANIIAPGFDGASKPLAVAVAKTGLVASSTDTVIYQQVGSPLPSTINFDNLVAVTAHSSSRVTEKFSGAFTAQGGANQGTDTGTRFIVRYTGLPAAARLFVPDVVAGSNADTPTSAGDYNGASSGGQYSPGKNELLLIRVQDADATGAKGTLASGKPGATTLFSSASEIGLVNGAGYAVYEVVDTNPAGSESAQIPAFIGLPKNSNTGGVEPAVAVNLAPLSTVATQSKDAPIPRFADVPVENDCTILNDCHSSYFPLLNIDRVPLQLTAPAGDPTAPQYLNIRNSGSGTLNWTVAVAYESGVDWLVVSPAQGTNNESVRVDAKTTGLQPGTYKASITVDAGPLTGSQTIPVTLTVTIPYPIVAAVTNAASADQGRLVAGSLATVWGTDLAGDGLQVTFDGTPGTILFSNSTQINVQVPPALAGKQTASVVVSAGGKTSAAFTANLASSAPAVFANGVANQDWTVNSALHPAPIGSVLQVFATGLPTSGKITAKIFDRVIEPLYGGPAPGLTGVQQVNVLVPPDLPHQQMTWGAYLNVCGGPDADHQVCSPAFVILVAGQ